MELKDKLDCGKTSEGSQSLGTAQPSVEITKCISFQKFRYDKRAGKKYQNKDFMELRLSNLSGREVRITIICIDAEDCNIYQLHPNGLIGKDCHDGIYDKSYVIKEAQEEIRIPYIRIDRFKTRGRQCDNLQNVLRKRAQLLPVHYKERCMSCENEGTSAHMTNTTDVRFGVIVSYHTSDFELSIHAISHVVGDANETTTLDILRLSQDPIPASGSLIDIFTSEEGPKLEGDNLSVYITCDYGPWKSDKTIVSAEDILYGKVIRYQMPPLYVCQDTPSQINAVLNLECPERNQYCSFSFVFSLRDDAVILKQHERKRTLPGQYIETSPKRMKMNVFAQNEKQRKTSKTYPPKTVTFKKGNLKKRHVSNATMELDVGVGSCNDMNFLPRESTAGESSINVELNAGQTEDCNFIVNNPSTSHRQGQVVEINSALWDHHQVNGLYASGHSRKVSPASNYTVSQGANTTPTDMQSGQDLKAQDEQEIMSLIQFLKGPQTDSPKSRKVSQIINPNTSTNEQNHTHLPEISKRQLFIGTANEGIQMETQITDPSYRIISSICQTADPVLSPCKSPISFENITHSTTTSFTQQSISPWEVPLDFHGENLIVESLSATRNHQRKENCYLNKGPIRNMHQIVANESSMKRTPEKRTKIVELQNIPPADTYNSQNEGKSSETPEQFTTVEILETLIDLEESRVGRQ